MSLHLEIERQIELLRDSLDDGLLGEDWAFEEGVLEKLEAYFLLLERWNEKHDLVSPAPQAELIGRHLVDSLAAQLVISSYLKLGSAKAFLDVGSGAGLPGLVLAICEPARRVYLGEPRQKRAVFLSEVRRSLELNNVEVLCERVENLSPSDVSGLGLTLSRALGEKELFLSSSAALFESGGYACELLGPSAERTEGEEFSSDSGVAMRLEKVIPYSLSASGPARQIAFWKCFT